MKVYRLIRELSKLNPNAEVRMNFENGDPVLFVMHRKNDDSQAWLEGKGDCDFHWQLTERYNARKINKENDKEFFTDLFEHGVTVEDIREYLDEEKAEEIQKAYKKYGLK